MGLILAILAASLLSSAVVLLVVRQWVEQIKTELEKRPEIVAMDRVYKEHAEFLRELKETRYILQTLLNGVLEINRNANPYRIK